MTSRKDLLEAQTFERRRMLGVLVGGAPGGHEAAGPRTGRPLLGGFLLAVLVVVGLVAVELLR